MLLIRPMVAQEVARHSPAQQGTAGGFAAATQRPPAGAATPPASSATRACLSAKVLATGAVVEFGYNGAPDFLLRELLCQTTRTKSRPAPFPS
jgi:hypothetical protein